MMPDEELIILWESPKIVPPEFRLYYDNKGKVICYTCDKIQGNYIVIDKETYAESRPDVRVIDGKLLRTYDSVILSKLVIDSNEGINTTKDDISIVVDDSYTGLKNKWKLKTSELV